MTYTDVCTGVSAATLAYEPLGWKAVAYSEIEPFPCTVLAHRYPDTPNLGDMTRLKELPDERVRIARALANGKTLDQLCSEFGISTTKELS